MEINENTRVIDLNVRELINVITSTLKANEKYEVKELPKFLTVPELAKLTGYSVATIHQKNCNRKIPGGKKLNSRVLFDTETILEWIESESIYRPTEEEQLKNAEIVFEKRMRKRK